MEHKDPEVQQRAVEYYNLLDLNMDCCQEMPTYNEGLQGGGGLLKRIFQIKSDSKAKDQTLVNEQNKMAELDQEKFKTSSLVQKQNVSMVHLQIKVLFVTRYTRS